ncbi:CD9 antigen-like [Centruroides sculpturatus]|uniref:CD9 antigen-like n=1 Tax=Centruroides sculpturatus TaxID=218467 RepID=UPI000C6E06BF|nr:CD9 antigen-like [Centruroides sculpturatus]XP_023229365.1 CD9 antigen-like [Centruroides sculpturatus]
MDSAMACMKYFLFTLNFIIWCLGGALAGIGIFIRSDDYFWSFQRGLALDQYYQACYIIITVGVILLVVGFLGCCGAAMDSPCMLLTYILIMAFIIILELATAVLVWKIADGEKLQEILKEKIRDQIEKRSRDDEAKQFVKLLQMHLECCGAQDKNDYGDSAVPESCNSQRTNNVFIYGCAENLRRYLEKKAGLMGGLVLGIGFIQIMALVFTTCLFCALREEAKEYV